MPRVLITEFMDRPGIDALEAHCEVVYDPELFADPRRLEVEVASADALIVRNRTRVTAELVEAGVKLAVVGRLGVGLDNIDLDACRRRQIPVRTAGTANADAVAEYVIAALLVLHRPALTRTPRIVAGEWPRNVSVGRELRDRRLGLIGLGATALAVADRARGLGMQVGGHDPYLEEAPATVDRFDRLEDMLTVSDAVSVHVPLVEATTGLLDARHIALLPPGAVIVDASRGGVVEHGAVVDALRSGALAGAALDVFPDEPPSDPSMYRDTPNLILTPHIAGLTRESNARVAMTVASGVLEELT